MAVPFLDTDALASVPDPQILTSGRGSCVLLPAHLLAKKLEPSKGLEKFMEIFPMSGSIKDTGEIVATPSTYAFTVALGSV